ncbi:MULTISPECIES: DNA glycosylase AlkZ-like family protein [Nocardia]|uniref:DNA glycosylase AlkZ-like family protein n=1 Tax=Nocardia TaxID=1817 RepID=UPI001895353B|nr:MULTISPECIES: crosslink repair DNA glycosylase YcaQ family protein [Nocardia]MBF6347743.1 YcaQ family DNA glycosylase [Nocardia flavorosea]
MSSAWLRANAVSWSLPQTPGTLAGALADMEFVQADPIRAPARAQDLILRQRVRGYRAGDLDRHYRELGIDEDMVYAYGYIVPRLRSLLHPRRHPRATNGAYPHDTRSAEVLEFVRERGVVHPRELQEHFGHRGVVNAWGGTSSATTVLLEELHRYGLLRVADRVSGVRRYEPAPAPAEPAAAPGERRRALALRIARTLAPAAESTLTATVNRAVRPIGGGTGSATIRELRTSGELAGRTVDGVRYLWPADLVPTDRPAPARVRFLAPFDPLVWDRKRFGAIWGWDYRFEAYTPAAKRIRGYYAMPMLWRDRVIGWATCTGPGSEVEVGFADGAPASKAFATALDAEIARLRAFLGPK